MLQDFSELLQETGAVPFGKRAVEEPIDHPDGREGRTPTQGFDEETPDSRELFEFMDQGTRIAQSGLGVPFQEIEHRGTRLFASREVLKAVEDLVETPDVQLFLLLRLEGLQIPEDILDGASHSFTFYLQNGGESGYPEAMRSSDNRAFKEWAVVCRALAQGRQILILRKGGIAEGPRGFEVTDRQFFLFPTYLHQAPESVVPEWRDQLAGCVDPAPGTVSIAHYAVVSSWLRIASIEKLRALRGLHIWSDAQVEERFRRWSEESVVALMVRVYALPRPVVLESTPEYAGCKSWITLAEQVSLNGVVPVLDDEAFEQRLLELKRVVA